MLVEADFNVSLEDGVVSDESAEHRVLSADDLPEDWFIADISLENIERFKDRPKSYQMVVWNALLGGFEIDSFAEETTEIPRG
jgi:3-phosphoglycerate kinase